MNVAYKKEFVRIKELLKAHPRGLTITEIAKNININRNSVARYMDVLTILGQVEMRNLGPAKVFYPSQRVPMSAMLNFSSDHILVLDDDLQIIQISDNLLTLLNTEREAILGLGIEDSLNPIFTSQELQTYLKAGLDGKEITFEKKIHVEKGEIDVYVKILPTTFDDGSIGLTWILQDITERKKAEEALLQKTRQQEILLSSIPAFVYFKDTNSRFIAANRAFSDLMKTPLDQVPGKTSFDFFPQEEAEQIHEVDKDVMESGKPRINFEVQYTNIAGEKRWASTSKVPYFDENGNVTGMVGITIDITEHKQAEEELVRLSTAVKMSRDSIVISDLDGNIVEVNEATLKMYGSDDKEELLGKNSFDLIAPEEREKALAGMRETLKKGYVDGREYNIVTKDGGRVPVEMSVAIMKNSNGRPTGFVGISRDITERKSMEKALKIANHTLTEEN